MLLERSGSALKNMVEGIRSNGETHTGFKCFWAKDLIQPSTGWILPVCGSPASVVGNSTFQQQPGYKHVLTKPLCRNSNEWLTLCLPGPCRPYAFAGWCCLLWKHGIHLPYLSWLCLRCNFWCCFHEGFCWRWPCWRVSSALPCMGVTRSSSHLHKPGFLPQEPPHLVTQAVSSRELSEWWCSVSTTCFVMGNDGTGCTHFLPLLTSGETCALFDRQGFSGTCSLLAPLWGKHDEERVQQQHKRYIWVAQQRTCRTWMIKGAVGWQ